MPSFRELIREKIESNRPKLGVSSVTTYVSCLFNIYKKMGGIGDNLDFFDDAEPILKYIKDTDKILKTTLSALYVLTNNDKYREVMLDQCKVVNDRYQEQTKSQKEQENWISIAEIKSVYDALHDKVLEMFKMKMIHHDTVISYLLVGLLGGVAGCAPRRSQDYSLLKVRNYDPKTDNYYKAGKMYFHIYKTAKKYGLQTLDVPKEIDAVIKKFIKCNKSDYLLFSNNDNHLSSSQITRILNKAFGGKRVSTDILRHIYLTNLYKDVPALKKLNETAEAMSHSVGTAMTYVKKD